MLTRRCALRRHAGYYSASLLPSRRGFDSVFGFYRGGIMHEQHCALQKQRCRTHGGANLYDFSATDTAGVERHVGRRDEHATSLYAARASELIAQHAASAASAASPLFLLIAWSAPHLPYQAQPGEVAAVVAARGAAWFSSCSWLSEMYGGGHGLPCEQQELEGNSDDARGIYVARKHSDAMCVGVDTALATLRDALEAAGLWATTLMIFASDNGGKLENHQTNFPLQGGKFSNLEGGIRTVAALGGGFLPAALRGRTSHAVVHITDW